MNLIFLKKLLITFEMIKKEMIGFDEKKIKFVFAILVNMTEFWICAWMQLKKDSVYSRTVNMPVCCRG